MLIRSTKTRLIAGALALMTLTTAVSALPEEREAAGAQVTTRLAAETAALASAAAPQRDLYGVRVDGVPMTTDPKARVMSGVTYVSLRAVTQAVVPSAQISWSGKSAHVSAASLELTATPGQCYLVANGRYLYVEGEIQALDGAVMVPLNTLLKALDATCVWQADGSVDIRTGSGAITPAAQFYNADDLYWLSRIIYAESGNQPLSGKMAVGNVVLNRVKSPRFPNTVKSVVFQKNQFTPARSGSINRTPNAESVLAAKLCLDGGEALDGVLYFNRVGLKSWASRNRPYVATIAQHTFYA